MDLYTSLKNFTGNYFGFNNTISVLENQLSTLQNNLQTIINDETTNKNKLEQLQQTIDAINKEKELEILLTNKIPKTERYYSRWETDGEYSVDVRDFLMIYDNKIPIVSGSTNDIKALEALRWVRKNITYTPDNSSSTYKKDEYWAYAYQTLS